MAKTVGVLTFTNDEGKSVEYETQLISVRHLKEFFDFKYDLFRYHEYIGTIPEKIFESLEDKQWIDKPWPIGYQNPRWIVYYVDSGEHRAPLDYWNTQQRVTRSDLEREYTKIEIKFE